MSNNNFIFSSCEIGNTVQGLYFGKPNYILFVISLLAVIIINFGIICFSALKSKNGDINYSENTKSESGSVEDSCHELTKLWCKVGATLLL